MNSFLTLPELSFDNLESSLYFLFIFFVLGIILGSFFSVVIYRTPKGISIITPPSACPNCSIKIRVYDNIPLLSWLMLNGKCRNCRQPISGLYPLIELFTGVLFVLLLMYFSVNTPGPNPALMLSLSYLALITLPVMVLDFRHLLIPDSLIIPGMVLGILISLFPGGLTPLDSISAGLGMGLLLWGVGKLFQWMLKKEAMGFGDVKLLAMLGFLFGLNHTFFTLFIGSILGSVYGLFLLWHKKTSGQLQVPFGPFLCLGALFYGFFPWLGTVFQPP